MIKLLNCKGNHMKKLLAPLCAFGLLLSACGQPAASQPQDENILHIVATTYPVYLFTTAVTEGAEGVEVSLLVNQQTSCLHDYTLTVADMKAIEGADVIVMNGADRWEIDEFLGDNQGLVLAELELASEDSVFEHPAWLGEEVTGQPGYYNSFLARNPYKTWKQTTETKSKGDKTE